MSRLGFGIIGNVPVRSVVELAQLAEKFGYDSFWMHETYFHRDAFSYLGPLALHTSKISLATGCINPYTRHPVLIAMSMASLDEASAGRTILGIGTGYLTRLDQMGISHPRPVAYLEESLTIIKKLLRGEDVTFQGQLYNLRGVKPFFPKTERPIPIYLAGWRPRMIELAARVADGYLARATESTQSLTALTESLMNACKSSGRDPSQMHVAAYVLCCVRKNSEEAKQAMRNNPFTIYQFAVMEDYVLAQTGFDASIRKQIADFYWKGDLGAASRKIPDGFLDSFTAAGDEDEVIDKIKEYSKIAMPVLQPIGADPNEIKAVLETGRGFLAGWAAE